MVEQARTILDQEEMARAIRRMGHEVVEQCGDLKELVLIGIRSRGVHLARRLARHIGEIGKSAPALAVIDVKPFRDDRSADERAAPGAFEIEAPVDERYVVLVDDVIFRGRTIRAAMDAVERLGQPKRILVAALVDRGDRELPIRADIVGKNIAAVDGERVNVRFSESDGIDQVVVVNWPGQGRG